MKQQTVTLDVCEDIRNGREPFSKIMGTVSALEEGQNLLLIAPFEPLPLFGLLANRGFRHSAREVRPGRWEVLFKRGEVPPATAGIGPRAGNCAAATPPAPAEIVELDARGLEPPQPMVKILETLTALPEGAELRAHTDRRPVHLHAQLAERAFIGESREQTDGSFVTHIRRR